MPYKFKIGDIVTFRRRASPTAPSDAFEVIKQLPGTEEPEYHVKSAHEPHQRIARESELEKA